MNQYTVVAEDQSDKLILNSVSVEPDPELPGYVSMVEPTPTANPGHPCVDDLIIRVPPLPGGRMNSDLCHNSVLRIHVPCQQDVLVHVDS